MQLMQSTFYNIYFYKWRDESKRWKKKQKMGKRSKRWGKRSGIEANWAIRNVSICPSCTNPTVLRKIQVDI